MTVFRSVLRCVRIQSSLFSSQLVRGLSTLTNSGDPRLPLIPQTLDPVLVRNFADLKIKDVIEICPITSLEDNKRLAEMNLSQSPKLLDKIVAHILKKDYMVQKMPLMLNKKLLGKTFAKIKTLNVPVEVKIGKYNASDFNLIDFNQTELLRELKLEDQKEAVIKELFKHSDEELHLEKVNVLGSFLGRGLLYLWSHT